MKKLLEHKWHYISLVVIFGLFLISVQVRQEKLSLPLSPEHEWITAHTLITCEIWDEAGGPQAHGFNPVYTYKGKGSKTIGTLGGVMDEDGDLHYTSYPPFSFIFAYYVTKLLGGPDVPSIRAFGLITHFLCAVLIYLIFIKMRKHQRDSISIAGLTAAILYLFSTGMLWGHSIIYFSDTLVQLFILLAILYSVKLLKQDYKNEKLFLLAFGAIVFFGTYTEWLALFFAFFAGLTFLIYYFIQKKKIFLKSFLVLGISSALAIGLTLYQYSTIAGWDELIRVSNSKYEERSGNQEDIEGLEIYNWDNPRSMELMETFINRNFAMAINMLGISFFFLIPILIWRKSREKIAALGPKIIIVVILIFSVLLHYLLFFNFNAIHNFSNIKTGLLMILTIAVIISIVEESLNWKLNLIFTGVLLFLLIPRISKDKQKFDSLYSYQDFNQGMMVSAKIIREHRDPDKLILGNFFPTPSYIYEAHHNIFPVADSSHCKTFMEYFQGNYAQYYQHENSFPVYMLELELKEGQVVVLDRIDF